MLSAKKSFTKRILIIIITALIMFSAVSMVATIIIYDSIFTRYDADVTPIPEELMQMVDNRQKKEYLSGENKLSGYLYKSETDNGRDTLIIIAPGFRASIDNYLWQISSLLDYGWSVFAFDTTGSCKSEGESAIGFAQELCDMEATLEFVEKNGRFGYNNVVLLGHSRGGYAACCALSLSFDVSAVVSLSGINSAMEGVIGSATEYVGPLAYGNYGFLWLYQAMLFGTETLNLSADEEISQSEVPVLIVHGAKDTQVPADKFSIYSHKDEIESDAVEYIICEKENQDGHLNLLFDADGTANDELMYKINDFLVRSIK